MISTMPVTHEELMPVPFGINFFSSVRPEQKSARQYFDEALHLSVLADQLGYSHVRTVEHYFRPYGGMTPNPIVFLSAVAALTRRIRLVTGAVIPIFNHPIKIAGETAMLDAISGGRLEPYLQPGMRVLDVGCGPGSITVGLAELVAPAEVVGLDLQPGMVERARTLAAERHVSNARFEVASVYELPFPNGSFDAVLASGLLIGLREPVQALGELRRVLRPGGIVGLRDADMGADIFTPVTPLLEQWWTWRPRILEHNGGQPLSRHHRRRLLEAGFARAEAWASASNGGSLAETRQHAAFFKAQLAGMARTAIAAGWLDQATVDAIAAELDQWAERPDAFSARIYCESIGWVEG